ncbi:MAG: transglycosylase domain-containing protein [Candidatus Riflebacteria bacterium]|nr:transglycosylase domain-containing protein [Candidatus Riflebacteria bacterium]
MNYIVPDISPDIRAKLQDWGGICSRDGEIIRLLPDYQGMFKVVRPVEKFPQALIDAIITAEDKRFFSHKGLDPMAMGRAFWQMISTGKVISGASTITQQLIRLTKPAPRTFATKIREIFMAIKLEGILSKQEILNAYLNLAPMGGNLQGAPLASKIYFKKGVEALTVPEAALLAAIPQSPTRLNPKSRKDFTDLKKRRDLILKGMAENGKISPETYELALKMPIYRPLGKFPFIAPHFCDWFVRKNGKPRGEVITSLDVSKQKLLESSIQSHKGRLSQAGAFQACGMVVNSETMEILAMSGSYAFNNINLGFINGCDSKRSGGSILKPFLYALALEKGFFAGSSIPDTRQDFRTPDGDYMPSNSTRKYYGPVSIRSALGNSLNIAAIKVLNAIGVRNFYDFLVEAGILKSEKGAPDRLGLGLAIGNPEITMVDLIQAYGLFTHGGELVELRSKPGQNEIVKKLVQPESAYVILDILSDSSARILTFGNPRFFTFDKPVALKTGTSTNYRDCWLVAITRKHIIAFWVGNFDGKPTYGLSGAVACGPTLKHLLTKLEPGEEGDWYKKPATLQEICVCGISGGTPGPFCPGITRELYPICANRPPICEFHTNSGSFHELPMEYAEWIQKRHEIGIPDSFRLVQGIQPVNPLESGFQFNDAPSVTFSRIPNKPVTAMPVFLATITIPVATFTATQASMPVATLPSLASPPLVLSPNSASTTVLATAFSAVSSTTIVEQPHLRTVSSLPILVRPEDSLPKIGGAAKLKIVSPHDGDRFVMANGNENLIMLKAFSDSPIPEVIWLVDGVEISRCLPPFTSFWRLRKGVHQISCIGTGDESSQIEIEVE